MTSYWVTLIPFICCNQTIHVDLFKSELIYWLSPSKKLIVSSWISVARNAFASLRPFSIRQRSRSFLDDFVFVNLISDPFVVQLILEGFVNQSCSFWYTRALFFHDSSRPIKVTLNIFHPSVTFPYKVKQNNFVLHNRLWLVHRMNCDSIDYLLDTSFQWWWLVYGTTGGNFNQWFFPAPSHCRFTWISSSPVPHAFFFTLFQVRSSSRPM